MAICSRLLALTVLIAMLMISIGSSKDWWRSDAGKVTEHRDRDNVTCALILKNDDGQIEFLWSNRLPLRVIVERPDWTLQDNRMWVVSFRVGKIGRASCRERV